jgi:hypothetical protein
MSDTERTEAYYMKRRERLAKKAHKLLQNENELDWDPHEPKVPLSFQEWLDERIEEFNEIKDDFRTVWMIRSWLKEMNTFANKIAKAEKKVSDLFGGLESCASIGPR